MHDVYSTMYFESDAWGRAEIYRALRQRGCGKEDEDGK